MSIPPRGRRLLVRLLLCAAVALGGCADESPPADLYLIDLEGRPVDPFAKAEGEANVFIFVRSDCPISNRYAPEVRRLHDHFSSQGVRFWLVYPDPEEPVEAIRTHLRDYRYPLRVLRDPRQTLVQRTRVRVTPEAAVFVPDGSMVYRGRIDDRYVAFGKERAAPKKRDLYDVLDAIVGARPLEAYTTRATGCTIPSL
jgi:hypothetical protein